MTHVSVDIETLGDVPNSIILSIGACKFDFEKQEILDTFGINIDPESCKQFGLESTEATVKFWESQSEEIKNLWKTDQKCLPDALLKFRDWFGSKDYPLWAWRKEFDIAILRNAYHRTAVEIPWDWRKVHCVFDFAKFNDLTRIKSRYPHSAMHDAIAQAKTLKQIMDGILS